MPTFAGMISLPQERRSTGGARGGDPRSEGEGREGVIRWLYQVTSFNHLL